MYTPDNINQLRPDQVFVFGANRGGHHGAGAAKTALKWGAKWGNGEGHYGQTYALPTKHINFRKSLDLDDVAEHVDTFIAYAKAHPELQFLVTKIGCGLAHFKAEDIAPLFVDAMILDNVVLPKDFFDILSGVQYVIYERPSDYPGDWVVKRWNCKQDPPVIDMNYVKLGGGLDAARAYIPKGYKRIPHRLNDDPVIYETWVTPAMHILLTQNIIFVNP